MKVIAWNCLGLGNTPVVRGLLRCHKAKEVDILLLSETKLDKKRMIVLKKKLGVEDLEVVDCEGKGGGACCVVEEMNQCGFEGLIEKPH